MKACLVRLLISKLNWSRSIEMKNQKDMNTMFFVRICSTDKTGRHLWKRDLCIIRNFGFNCENYLPNQNSCTGEKIGITLDLLLNWLIKRAKCFAVLLFSPLCWAFVFLFPFGEQWGGEWGGMCCSALLSSTGICNVDEWAENLEAYSIIISFNFLEL